MARGGFSKVERAVWGGAALTLGFIIWGPDISEPPAQDTPPPTLTYAPGEVGAGLHQPGDGPVKCLAAVAVRTATGWSIGFRTSGNAPEGTVVRYEAGYDGNPLPGELDLGGTKNIPPGHLQSLNGTLVTPDGDKTGCPPAHPEL